MWKFQILSDLVCVAFFGGSIEGMEPLEGMDYGEVKMKWQLYLNELFKGDIRKRQTYQNHRHLLIVLIQSQHPTI